MTVKETRKFRKDFTRLPSHIQRQAIKQLQLLKNSPRHPSLRLKKMSGKGDIWEARVTRGYRMVLRISSDMYIMVRIGPHDILKKT